MSSRSLTRPRRGKVVAGVCAALAQRLGRPPWVVRTAFVASCLLPGPQILLYVFLWAALPREPA